MNSKTIYYVLFGLILMTTYSFASEWEPVKPPSLDKNLSIAYTKFWLAVENATLEEAIRSSYLFNSLQSDNAYRLIIDNITELIKRYKGVVDNKLLARFLLLEKKRMYWQKFQWWPDTTLYFKAEEQVTALVTELSKILEFAINSDFKAELLYRIGLCYSDNGPIGLREYGKAEEAFKLIENNYINSMLIDRASFELILTKIKASEETNQPSLSIDQIIEMLTGFITKYPKSHRDIEARKLLGGYYELKGEYQSAEREYLGIVNRLCKTKETLELLDKLSFIYRSEMRDKAKEKMILERIIKDYPDSYSASYAKARIEEIREEK